MAKLVDSEPSERGRVNTISMLGQVYSLLGFQIVDRVVGASFPQNPKHSAVFAQIEPEGSRLTDLARRAKLIILTDNGRAAIEAGRQTIVGLEDRITEILGEVGHRSLREMQAKLLAEV